MLELSTLEDRLGKLERENHWLRLWLAALGLGLVALVVAAAAASNSGTVRARRFEVVDANGIVRATLGLEGTEYAALLLRGKDAHSDWGVGLHTAGGPHLTLAGPSGRTLLTGGSGSPSLDMLRLHSVPGSGVAASIGLSVDAANGATLSLWNSANKPSISLSSGGSDLGEKANINLYDTNGTPRLTLGSVDLVVPNSGGREQTPASSMTAFDKAGGVIATWPHR